MTISLLRRETASSHREGLTLRLKPLGQSGTLLPEVGLGTYAYQGGVEPLRAGIDAGAAFVDTAESYGTESVVGEAIRAQRRRVFLATKVSPAHFRFRDLIAAADRSLRQLKTDYIDLYQLHEPNEEVPIEETLGALESLVEAGKVRFVGVSNFSVDRLQRAQLALARHRIVSNQVRYSIVDRTIEDGLLHYCLAQRITVIAYTPLARGLRHLRDCDPRGLLDELGRKYGRTPAQVALNWCLRRDQVVGIPKADSIPHVLENCGASGWDLAAEDASRLDQGIRFRRRSTMENVLRRLAPRGVKSIIKRAVSRLPASVRRRVV